MATSPLRFETLTGPALLPLLPSLASLRITVFREWPYLYEGDGGYEQEYLRAYAGSPGAAVVVAFDGEEPVGAATCQPMVQTHAAVSGAFRDAGLDPAQWCYYGESVLLARYRGQGAGVRFFVEREAHARALGLDLVCFCAVARPGDDPRRPADYTPLDGFWGRRGYAGCPELVCHFDWKEVGGTEEVGHPLAFWVKSLSGKPIA